jgi:hypothetical protein
MKPVADLTLTQLEKLLQDDEALNALSEEDKAVIAQRLQKHLDRTVKKLKNDIEAIPRRAQWMASVLVRNGEDSTPVYESALKDIEDLRRELAALREQVPFSDNAVFGQIKELQAKDQTPDE